MTTVKINDPNAMTPSQQVVADANAIAYKKDSKGRMIGARRPSKGRFVAVRKLVAADQWAKEDTKIDSYGAYLCASIDGDQIAPPTNELQLEALIVRLDDHGIRAVFEAIGETFGNAEDGQTKAGE